MQRRVAGEVEAEVHAQNLTMAYVSARQAGCGEKQLDVGQLAVEARFSPLVVAALRIRHLGVDELEAGVFAGQPVVTAYRRSS